MAKQPDPNFVVGFNQLKPLFGVDLTRPTLRALERKGLWPARIRVGQSKFGWLYGTLSEHLRERQRLAEEEAARERAAASQ